MSICKFQHRNISKAGLFNMDKRDMVNKTVNMYMAVFSYLKAFLKALILYETFCFTIGLPRKRS